jgi:hypothetical protein
MWVWHYQHAQEELASGRNTTLLACLSLYVSLCHRVYSQFVSCIKNILHYCAASVDRVIDHHNVKCCLITTAGTETIRKVSHTLLEVQGVMKSCGPDMLADASVALHTAAKHLLDGVQCNQVSTLPLDAMARDPENKVANRQCIYANHVWMYMDGTSLFEVCNSGTHHMAAILLNSCYTQTQACRHLFIYCYAAYATGTLSKTTDPTSVCLKTGWHLFCNGISVYQRLP